MSRRAPARQQTIKVVIEQAAPSSVARPEITDDVLRAATVETKRGKARL